MGRVNKGADMVLMEFVAGVVEQLVDARCRDAIPCHQLVRDQGRISMLHSRWRSGIYRFPRLEYYRKIFVTLIHMHAYLLLAQYPRRVHAENRAVTGY